MNTLRRSVGIAIVVACFTAGCASAPPPPPINYLALEIPKGPIMSVTHNAVQQEFSRGGWYIGNHNFRPAPDVASYFQNLSKTAGTAILRSADVEVGVPFAFDILFFGYNSGSDTATAKGR